MDRCKEREQATREAVGRAWLAWVAEHGQAPAQAQLAQLLEISRHAVGRALRYLEARGVPGASDSRRAVAVLGMLPLDHPAAVALRERARERAHSLERGS